MKMLKIYKKYYYYERKENKNYHTTLLPHKFTPTMLIKYKRMNIKKKIKIKSCLFIYVNTSFSLIGRFIQFVQRGNSGRGEISSNDQKNDCNRLTVVKSIVT